MSAPKVSLLGRKAGRRQSASRRARPKHERPELDLSLADPCPQCGSKRFELVDATNELFEIRCRKCQHTWITLPRNLRR
jgi:transcription elongation factor Elf1